MDEEQVVPEYIGLENDLQVSCINSVKDTVDLSVLPLDELEKLSQSPTANLSKRQRKKLLRRIEWLKNKRERRAKEKEKRKLKRAAMKEHAESTALVPKKICLTKMADSTCRIKIAIDLSFGNLMTERERLKCIKQIQRCYSMNRRAKAPLQLYLTGLDDSMKSHLSSVSGFDKWDIHLHDSAYTTCFDKDSIIYLTSESSEVLNDLDETSAYIIGGLVDHNRQKGLCHKLAAENGIKHARLPIDAYLVMKTRKILTIDQVFLTLLRVAEGLSWKESFLKTIPERKGAIAIEDASSDHKASNSDGSSDDCTQEEVS